MASFSIKWKTSAARELRKLPKPIIARLLQAVEALASGPRPTGVIKLTDTENTYRLRVGEYRIIYNIFDRLLVIEIIRVRDRKDAYK
jgi:mRNA interferase RelE/StbE